MSFKQKINIDFDWALLTILADSNYECEDLDNVNIKTLTFSSTKDDLVPDENFNVKIDFSNIPMSIDLDNVTPIQFLENDDFVNLYFLEETNYTIIFELKSSKTKLNHENLFKELISHEPEFFSCNKIKDNLFIVNLNFRSHVGKTFIDMEYDNVKFKLPLEIRSRKIDYEKDYPAMIADLAKYSSSLFFDIDSSLFHNYEQHDKKKETKYEDYMILEYIFKENNLPSVFEYLSKNLYSNIITTNEEVPISFAYNINEDELINLITNPNNVVEVDDEKFIFEFKDKRFVPIFINEIIYEDNIDVPENRFYKYFLEYLKKLIINLKNDDEVVGYIENRLEIFETKLNYFLSNHYFSEISKMYYVPFNSQVLQKKEGYRDIFEYYLMLDIGFKINCDLISNEIKGYEKRLSKIYEFWCYFKLYEIIVDLSSSQENFNHFINNDGDGWELTIETGFINEFNYILENGEDVLLSLAYNNEFAGPESNSFSDENIYKSYSLDMVPDFTVSIKHNDEIYFVHFDSKYKKNDGEVKSEDIHKMHTYKDSIEGSIGSFVLFPGNINSKKFYEEFSNNSNSVGAFPLNPLNNQEEIDDIKNYLVSIINRLFYS